MSRDCRRRPAVVAASRPWKASTRAVGAALVAVPLLPVAAGCDWLRPGGPPEDATIYVSSQDVDEATLIVASDFDQVPGGGVCDEPGVPCPEPFQLRRADTTLVDLPYTYDFEFTSKPKAIRRGIPRRVGAGLDVDACGDQWQRALQRLARNRPRGRGWQSGKASVCVLFHRSALAALGIPKQV